MATSHFHPAVGRGSTPLSRTHRRPSAAWPAIHAGRHTLIAAPTGSGKTLAAFLAAIDGLVREAISGCSTMRCRSSTYRRSRRCPTTSSAISSARCAASRESCAPGRCRARDSRAGAHRRHAAERARRDAQVAAAHPGDDAGVAVPACSPASPGGDALEHAQRSSSTRSTPSRATKRGSHLALSLERLAAPGRPPAAAHRPFRDAEAHRGGRALPDRRHRSADACVVVDSGHIRVARSGAGAARFAARGGDVQRGLADALRPASPR